MLLLLLARYMFEPTITTGFIPLLQHDEPTFGLESRMEAGMKLSLNQ
jgi:hypothetical protein